MPMDPLAKKFACKFVVAGNPIRLGERHQMLMAIQFPRDLAITDLIKIQVMNLEERFSGRTLPVYAIAMPIDFRSVVNIAMPEKIEPMFAESLSALDDLICIRWKSLAKSRA